MLHYLDVMIGFVFTMLVLSLAVTAMVQAVPVYLRNLKGVSLQNGLADMLVRIAYNPDGPQIAGGNLRLAMDQILRDPLLSPPRSFITNALSQLGGEITRLLTSDTAGQGETSRARAAVLHREEFVRLLLDFAGKADDQAPFPAITEARKATLTLLNLQTSAEARTLLANLRQRIADLELAHPAWSSSQRADKAILELLLKAPCKDFMAKLVGWYDQTIDRVEAAFTARVRNWTTVISAALVLVLQLDSLDLLARLNADGELREKVVASAVEAMENGTLKPYVAPKPAVEETASAAPAPPAAPSAAPPPADVPKPEAPAQPIDPNKSLEAEKSARDTRALKCAEEHLTNSNAKPNVGAYANCMGLAEASRLGLVEWPHSVEEWKENWTARETPFFLKLLGMLLSLGLLSLGAPFWYEMLSNLIKLRSTIAKKDEAAREERQTMQAG